MYNKKVLIDSLKNLGSAKAPTKQKDKIYTNNDALSPFVSSEGFKQGPPPSGSHYRIPGDTLYNPTPYPIEAVSDNGIRKTLKPYDTKNIYFPGATHVDEYEKNSVNQSYPEGRNVEKEFISSKKGGETRRVKLPNKKNSRGYSRSLEATNKFFTENRFFAKPKSRKNKVYDPNSQYYQNGGNYFSYEGRPDAKYMKKNDGWYINAPGTNDQYIKVEDPTGSRTKLLNEQAVYHSGTKAKSASSSIMGNVKDAFQNVINPINSDILKVGESISGGGYNKAFTGSGTPFVISHNGQEILPAATDGTYCSGYTCGVSMKVLQQRGLLDTMTPSQLKNFQKTWYGAKDFEKGKSETLSTKALEDYNLGKRIEHKEAKSGDIAQIWRNNGSGHSVIFKDWVTDNKGNRIGIKYRSSQANTKGVGDRTEMFDNNIDPDRIYVARLNNRSEGGDVITNHFQDGGTTCPPGYVWDDCVQGCVEPGGFDTAICHKPKRSHFTGDLPDTIGGWPEDNTDPTREYAGTRQVLKDNKVYIEVIYKPKKFIEENVPPVEETPPNTIQETLPNTIQETLPPKEYRHGVWSETGKESYLPGQTKESSREEFARKNREYQNLIKKQKEGGNVTTGHFQRGGATSPEAWGQEIKDIESQIGNPSDWTMNDYYSLQDKLNAYKDWRENTSEGQTVIDSHNEEGEYDIPLPEHLQDYTNGMMKSKLAYANEFGNPAAKRMINLPDNPYQFDSGDTGTHYMASMDNYAVPQIQDENGELMLGDYGPDSKEAIRFDSDEDARYFAEHYKDVSPGFVNAELTQNQIQEYAKGGYIIEDISVPELTQAKQGGVLTQAQFGQTVSLTDQNEYNKKLQYYNLSKNLQNYINTEEGHVPNKYRGWVSNDDVLKGYNLQWKGWYPDIYSQGTKGDMNQSGYFSMMKYRKDPNFYYDIQPDAWYHVGAKKGNLEDVRQWGAPTLYPYWFKPVLEREPLPEWKKLPIKHTETPALEIIPQRFNYIPKKQEPMQVANTSQTVMEPDPDRPGKYKVKEIRQVPYAAKFPGEGTWEPANAPRIIYVDAEGNETEEKPGAQLNTLNLQGETFKQGGSLLTKKVTCKKCGWEWDAADGGNDITTCHKCGGQGLVHAQFGGLAKYIPKLPAITVPSVLKSTYKINPLALKSVPFGIENYFQNGEQLQPHWLRGFPKVANKVTLNEFNDIASQIGYGKNYPSGPATDMEMKKLYDILSKTQSKNSLFTNSFYQPKKYPLTSLKRYSNYIPKTEVGSIKPSELFPNTLYATPSRRNNFNYETYGGYDKNWKEKAFFAGLLGTTLGLGTAVGVGLLAGDPTKNSINRKIGYPLYQTNLMSDPNITQKDTLINLNDNQLGYGQMKDSPEARILLGGDFVGDEENTVRPAKDWLHATYDDTYGDDDFKTKDIKSFYGVENGTLKLGSAKDFKSNTKIVPNRYDDGRYINKAKIAEGELRLVGDDGQPIYHNTIGSGGKIILHSKDNNKSIFISYSPQNVNKTVSQVNNFIKNNKNVKPIVIDNGRYIQWMQNNKGITDQNYSNFYSNDIQRGSNSGYNITIKKDGGSMDYQLGDEIDEATMEKLKELGYTFQMVK